MPSINSAPYINKKNNSQYWYLPRLVDRFYYSHFNRDPLCGLEEGEEYDDSRQHRLYNKSDVKEVLELFFKFLEWIIPEENLGKLYLSDCISLERVSKLPTVRRATIVDVIKTKGKAKDRELYVTHGRYTWKMNVTGDMYERQKKLRDTDPEFIAKKEELQKSVDERNKNEGNSN